MIYKVTFWLQFGYNGWDLVTKSERNIIIIIE